MQISTIGGKWHPVKPTFGVRKKRPYSLDAPFIRQTKLDGENAPQVVKAARVVLYGPPKPFEAKKMLLKTIDALPKGKQFKFLTFPGGFAAAIAPEKWEGNRGWKAGSEDFRKVLSFANREIAGVFDVEVQQKLKALKGSVDYITLGFDLYFEKQKWSFSDAELVAVYDVAKNKMVRWTGKSYPRPAEENRIIPVSDVASHLITLGKDRLLLLGCHDAHIFSKRAEANSLPDGMRQQQRRALKKLVTKFKPNIVLHHPHYTDTPGSWDVAWGGIKKEIKNLAARASGICYWNYYHGGAPQRKSLEAVVTRTRGPENVLDIVVRSDQV